MHVEPVHDDVQVHVLGAVHVPPFWQGDVQTSVRRDQFFLVTVTSRSRSFDCSHGHGHGSWLP